MQSSAGTSLRVVLAGAVGRAKRELADSLAGAPSTLSAAERLSVATVTRGVRQLNDTTWSECAGVPVRVVEAPDLCGAPTDLLPADAAAYICDVELPRSLGFAVDAVVLVVQQGRVSNDECRALNAVLANCDAPRIVAIVPSAGSAISPAAWISENEAGLRERIGLRFDVIVPADEVDRLRAVVCRHARSSRAPPLDIAPPMSFDLFHNRRLHVIAFGEVAAGLDALLKRVSDHGGRGTLEAPLFSCPVETWSDSFRQQAVVVHVMPELCASRKDLPWPASKSKRALKRAFRLLAGADLVAGLWSVDCAAPSEQVAAIVSRLVRQWPGIPILVVASEAAGTSSLPPLVRLARTRDGLELRSELLHLSRSYTAAFSSGSASARRLFELCVLKQRSYRRRAVLSRPEELNLSM